MYEVEWNLDSFTLEKGDESSRFFEGVESAKYILGSCCPNERSNLHGISGILK